MRYLIATFSLCLIALPLSNAHAGLMTLDINFTLEHVGGVDSLGFDGANINLMATFADGTVYGGGVGVPEVSATTHSLTISGAGSANGTYSDSEGLLYAPATGGAFLTDELFEPYTVPLPVGTQFFALGDPVFFTAFGLVEPLTIPDPGDYVTAANFVATPDPFMTNLFTEDGEYAIAAPGGISSLTGVFTGSTDPNFGSTAVPEPASVAVFGLGAFCLTGLGVYRQKRSNEPFLHAAE